MVLAKALIGAFCLSIITLTATSIIFILWIDRPGVSPDLPFKELIWSYLLGNTIVIAMFFHSRVKEVSENEGRDD